MERYKYNMKVIKNKRIPADFVTHFFQAESTTRKKWSIPLKTSNLTQKAQI